MKSLASEIGEDLNKILNQGIKDNSVIVTKLFPLFMKCQCRIKDGIIEKIDELLKKEEKEWEDLQKEIKKCSYCSEEANCFDHQTDARVLQWGIETLDEVKIIVEKEDGSK